MIEIENVSKHFVSRDSDRIMALTDVSISIRRNEFQQFNFFAEVIR